MKFEIISEGFVSQRQVNSPTAVAAGPRCALATDGGLICSYVVQSALGINDFVPMQARSEDGGASWKEEGPIWPQLRSRYSIFCSISRSPGGELFLFGTRTPIDQPGETFWSDATNGLKQNELIWSNSRDDGQSWSDPMMIPMPIPGSAEAPGPMCITRGNRWLACYAPYSTFDPNVIVERNQIVVVISDDQGQSWRHDTMMAFKDKNSGGAESWVIELADGRLLGTAWHVNYREDADYPNPFALSLDGGNSWQPSWSTGILGQSTALASLPDGRALFVYNQRKHGEPGVWLAVASPHSGDFEIETNAIVWRPEVQNSLPREHSQWTDFAFGEPSATLLPDGTLFIALWCKQASGQGIRYVKLAMT